MTWANSNKLVAIAVMAMLTQGSGCSSSRPHLPKATPYSEAVVPATPTSSHTRIQRVTQHLLQANPEIRWNPRLVIVATPAIELRPQSDGRLLISEGLLQHCVSDGQLSAAIGYGLARWVVEQEHAGQQRAHQQREPLPPLDFGKDGGRFGEADLSYQASLGRLGLDRRQPTVQASVPDAATLARTYLQRAGYSPSELDSILGLLQNPSAGN
ncbi:MAG: hypothetical protein C4297_13960 [Gemmataceae bacterium]